MTGATAGVRPRRASYTTYRKGASPAIVPVTLGPYGTAILDDFETTGAQNLTSRAGWGGAVLVNGDTTAKTDAAPDAAVFGPLQSNYWGAINGVASVRDSEGWCQVGAFNPATDACYVGTRVVAAGASFTLYSVEITSNTFKLARWNAASLTYLGGTLTQIIAEGDSVGVSCIGSRIQTWYRANGAGVWTAMHDQTDATIGANGTPLGIIGRAATGRSITILAVGGGDLSAHYQQRLGVMARRTWAGR